MRYISNKILISLACSLFFVYYVLSNFKPFLYINIIAGVNFNGYVLYYAASLFLLGIVVLNSFGNTEKYIKGYGILELIRNKKRDSIIKKVVVTEMLNVFVITCFIIIPYIIAAYCFFNKREEINTSDYMMKVLLFYLVSLSLVLWQALFEIIFDSRGAIFITLSLICIHISAGDVVMLYKKSHKLFYLFYTNFAFAKRNEEIHIRDIHMLLAVLIICIIQIILMKMAFLKKDIFSVKE